MNLIWEIKEEEIERWKTFIDLNKSNDFVLDRIFQNITRKKVDISKDRLWFVFVGCQVTTQQRSGPNSAVSRYLESKSPALNYLECRKSKNTEKLILRELSKAGLRRSKTIAKYLNKILEQLENGGWQELSKHLKTIMTHTSKKKERLVADYIRYSFDGLGFKQSRNYIQWLGLARHEIPIDSRITRKMRELGCTFVPKANALSDETVYLLIQDGLQQLSKKLRIYPCVLDACIFSSFDVKN